MYHLKRLLPAAALALAVVSTACKDSLGPEDVDVNVIQSSIQDLSGSFDNAAFQSMAGASFLFPVFPAARAAETSFRLLKQGQGSPMSSLLAQRRLAADLRASMNNPLALFPQNVLTKTFEWDANTHAYVLGNRTGAPANGLRIILYTVSSITGEPIVNQELGYLQLTDESTPQFDAIGVLITLGSTTVADYTITSTHQTNIDQLDADGFIREAVGTGQVDFQFNTTDNSQSGTSALTSDLHGSNGGSIHVVLATTVSTAAITIDAGKGDNHIRMDLTGTDDPADPIAGTVKYNGTVVANIAGTGDSPTFTAASGRTLRQGEVAALGTIFGDTLLLAFSVALAVLAPALIIASF